MSYIFMDESGDLGFKKPLGTKSSKYFIVTFLFTDNDKSIANCTKSVLRNLNKANKKKITYLHAYHEKPSTRKKLLQKIMQRDIKILLIYLNKEKVYTNLCNEKNILYNYVVNILLDRIFSKNSIDTNKTIYLIASRKDTNKFISENFKNYLKKESTRNHKLDINIDILAPHQNKCLQAVDFISWAIYRKYEKGDEEYYNMIKGKILEESGLFK